MSYIREDFLLNNQTAKDLYFGYAKDMPIFDYHCHLPERQILENKPFSDIFARARSPACPNGVCPMS